MAGLVLRFRPTRWERQVQRLEITTGEWLPDQEISWLQSPWGTVPGT